MCQFRCIFVSLCAIVTFFVSASYGSIRCTNVKEEYSKLKLGIPDVIPEEAIIDNSLEVCVKSLTPNEASCCSRDSEMQYVISSEKFVMDKIRSQNSHLKTLISDHMSGYKEKVMSLVRHAENQTGHQLSDWYSIPWSEHRHAVSTLFGDIEEFLQSNHKSIPNSISKFFDDIFPVMFKNTIYHGTSESFTHHFHHCLTQHRKEIIPHPFDDYPERVARNLNNGLTIVKAYMEALSVVMETINTTDALVLEDECKHAVTRMQYCSHCRGLINVKPCKGFCLDVMRGCLSKMAEIGPEWSDVISSVELLVRELTDKRVEDMFRNLVDGISDAMMHSMVHAPDYYGQAHNICDIPKGISREHLKPVKDNGVTSVKDIPSFGPLVMEVMQVTLDLLDSKGMYTRIADDICEEAAMFEQDPQSGSCWNGTSVSVYLREAVDLDILSQARNNQEVKVTLMLDPKLRLLKDKLSVVNLNLQSHTRKKEGHRPKSYMVSDDPIVYASGDDFIGTVNIGTGTTLTDDEDLYNDYMSGSGSGFKEDEVVGTGPGKPLVDIIIPGGSGPGETKYEDNRGGTLTPDKPPSQETKSFNPQPNSRKPNAAVSATVCWSLLLSTICISIFSWKR